MYYFLPGLDGSCSYGNQPWGTCKEAWNKTLRAIGSVTGYNVVDSFTNPAATVSRTINFQQLVVYKVLCLYDISKRVRYEYAMPEDVHMYRVGHHLRSIHYSEPL